MSATITWHSQRGERADDNRDYCGVALNEEATLCIVLDGSSATPNSGHLVRQIAKSLVEWFAQGQNVAPNNIVDQLRDTHTKLRQTSKKQSASYVIALIHKNRSTALLHAGDCLAGISRSGAEIAWQTTPHTLVNVARSMTIEEIALSPLRNRLTRSFRMGEFMVPDVQTIELKEGDRLVLATDGYWAKPMSEPDDDCSVLTMSLLDHGQDEVVNHSADDNLYLVRSRPRL